MEIKIKKLKENATIPTRGSAYAAGYDLYACIDNEIEIAPHETVKIGTGIAVELPDHTFAGVFARSGLATKQGLRPSNCVGVIDADYRGECIVALHNDSDICQKVVPNERIGQMILLPFISMDFIEVDELSDTVRGSSGFGSTGLTKE